jgi:CubicO group peptidase (beta-lactamase class C family)
MKKRILILLPFLLIAGGLIYLNTLAPIITGYAAKNLASGIFVAGRTQESLEKEDLNFSFIKYNRNKVDFDKKEVTSRFLFWKSKAIYIDGFGCTLVRDYSEEVIRSRGYTIVNLPDVNPDTIAWPAGDLLADTIPVGIKMDKLNKALDDALSNELPMKGTFAVAVAYKNQLVAERYRDGFSPDYLYLSWSMAKSFTNALVGILAYEGRMDINEPAQVMQWQNDERRKITLAHLLNMNSGLEFNEDYGSNSDVNQMLFKKGNMAAFAMDKPAVAEPDADWHYSSGSTNIVSQLIRQTMGNDAEYYAFPREALFNRIGMRSTIFETDPSGTFIGSSYIYATMRDYLRFGLLYLNDGNWLGEQVLPEGWVDFTRLPASGSGGGYGAFFWLNHDNSYPGVPADMFCCRGHDGQYIYIIPSKDLVVVRTGFSKKGEFDLQEFLRSVVEAVDN